jgi:transposase
VLTLPSSVRIFVAAEAVDLRRGFDGLAAATRSVIREEPESGHLFVFLNRRRNRIKLLVWDRTGYLIVYKRLEAGTFALATAPPREAPAGWARRQPPIPASGLATATRRRQSGRRFPMKLPGSRLRLTEH